MLYAELHAHSSFSLLDGASQPEELAARAAELGLPALALTDHNAVYGALRFIRAAREHGIQPILGVELTLDTGHHLTLLVEEQAGWHNLCYLISRAQAEAPKGEAMLPAKELIGCTNGLVALSGCRRGEIVEALLTRQWRRAHEAARRLRDLFGPDHFWIELQNHRRPEDALLVARLADLASSLGLGCVATNNVHYATRDGYRLQDVLVCIGHNTTLDEAVQLRRDNSEYYLKRGEEMAALFPEHPEAIANTVRLAERCQFEPSYGLQDLPRFETPGGMSSESYLRRLCEQGLQERYGDPPAQVHAQLQRELEVITRAGLANYFLIVWDIVRFAREHGIRCQGRGSAANCLVAYLLHISPIDPLAHDLVFERFLSAERLSADAGFMPDIDIDFDAQRREEVIQYVYKRYKGAHTAMACTFVTYRNRSALRDVGKALGLTPDVIAAARRKLETEGDERAWRPPKSRAKMFPEEAFERVEPRFEPEGDPDSDSERTPLTLLIELAQELVGLPRHLGIHSGGMIVTDSPLMGRVPTEPASMPDRVVVQWDKDGLEDAGLIKIDLLGLRMLSAISDSLALIGESRGKMPDLDELSFDDPTVYEMIADGDNVGIFQVESRAETELALRLKPRCFGDLIVNISLVRPGPIQGNMVHPYLRRRQGIESIVYAHPLLEPALEETLGVVLFQEQVLKVARDLAGFTPGQGELLRRALGSKRATEAIERLRGEFLSGAQSNGVSLEVAEAVFEQLRAFGGYSFAKSHAASFAVLVYQSAWLKKHHFLPFMVALLNNQPMGFWKPSVLIGEVKRRGERVLPVDIHESQAQCSLEEGAIRLGFNYVKRLGEAQATRIIEQREEAPFTSLADFWQRTRLGRRITENLIVAGAMDGWGTPRRHLLWELGTLRERPDALTLERTLDEVDLPALSAIEALVAEQTVLGLSAGEHVMTHMRRLLSQQGVISSGQLPARRNGERVHLAGLLVVHQSPPTAKGFHFLTLEDEDGLVDVIVRPQLYARYRRVLHTAHLLKVSGTLQREGENVNLIADDIVAL